MTDRDRALPQNSTQAAHHGLVRVGIVGQPHGLRGALRLSLDNADSATPPAVSRLWLEHEGTVREYRVRGVLGTRRQRMRVELEGVTSAEMAATLRGAVVFVAEADLPPPAEGEFYDFRAIGCEVVTLDGRRLGTVAEIFATGANDVIVVRDGGAEVLVPVIADVVKRLDFPARRIVIDAVPGLLD